MLPDAPESTSRGWGWLTLRRPEHDIKIGRPLSAESMGGYAAIRVNMNLLLPAAVLLPPKLYAACLCGSYYWHRCFKEIRTPRHRKKENGIHKKYQELGPTLRAKHPAILALPRLTMEASQGIHMNSRHNGAGYVIPSDPSYHIGTGTPSCFTRARRAFRYEHDECQASFTKSSTKSHTQETAGSVSSCSSIKFRSSVDQHTAGHILGTKLQHNLMFGSFTLSILRCVRRIGPFIENQPEILRICQLQNMQVRDGEIHRARRKTTAVPDSSEDWGMIPDQQSHL
ncbi:predicted protein [Histoplasma capsulatum G186AR]|uniref:Uncharacterized protein n=1 Tax=Ajellomyces capsulatus (strain G186AR / H82 / ATCC MYA-2454 / RMSCC 2432) TaxID=447093 RepID=C0NVR6_AJECG|nr:uncharacterized protein HCBG_07246 [Histoplasma capsulatum G186AR]EEH04605.1 predicted protein [Histoplasma capsulatum G186AR]